jgi:hypothetical protein
MSYGRGGTYADDYDDDSDSEDDPGPPPEGFSGIYVGDQGSDDDFSDDDDEPPPPPEGHMGVFGNGSGGGGMHFPPARNQFPPMHAQFPPTRAASASTSSTPGKGSARQWTEQQLAMQRRGVDSEANGSPGEYDDDDSSGDELEDGAGADAGSSGDEGGRPATASMSREDAQAAALGMTPSMKDGRLDALAESRTGIEGGAVEKPDFKREEAAPEKKKLGRWGTGGVGVSADLEASMSTKPKRGLFGRFGGAKAPTPVKEEPAEDAAEAAPPASEEEADAAAEAAEEASGRPPMRREGAVFGWVFKRGGLKSKGWRKRFCVYEPKVKRFTCAPIPPHRSRASLLPRAPSLPCLHDDHTTEHTRPNFPSQVLRLRASCKGGPAAQRAREGDAGGCRRQGCSPLKDGAAHVPSDGAHTTRRRRGRSGDGHRISGWGYGESEVRVQVQH